MDGELHFLVSSCCRLMLTWFKRQALFQLVAFLIFKLDELKKLKVKLNKNKNDRNK